MKSEREREGVTGKRGREREKEKREGLVRVVKFNTQFILL